VLGVVKKPQDEDGDGVEVVRESVGDGEAIKGLPRVFDEEAEKRTESAKCVRSR
jgi:hypothetical protein